MSRRHRLRCPTHRLCRQPHLYPTPTPSLVRLPSAELIGAFPNARQVQLLVLVNVTCVVVLAFFYGITGSMAGVSSGFEYTAELLWMAWACLSDTGGSPDGPLWPTRGVQVLVAVMAMFVFALICGFVEQAALQNMSLTLTHPPTPPTPRNDRFARATQSKPLLSLLACRRSTTSSTS